MTAALYLSRVRLRRDATVKALLPLLQGEIARSTIQAIIWSGRSSLTVLTGVVISCGERWSRAPS